MIFDLESVRSLLAGSLGFLFPRISGEYRAVTSPFVPVRAFGEPGAQYAVPQRRGGGQDCVVRARFRLDLFRYTTLVSSQRCWVRRVESGSLAGAVLAPGHVGHARFPAVL